MFIVVMEEREMKTNWHFYCVELFWPSWNSTNYWEKRQTGRCYFYYLPRKGTRTYRRRDGKDMAYPVPFKPPGSCCNLCANGLVLAAPIPAYPFFFLICFPLQCRISSGGHGRRQVRSVVTCVPSPSATKPTCSATRCFMPQSVMSTFVMSARGLSPGRAASSGTSVTCMLPPEVVESSPMWGDVPAVVAHSSWVSSTHADCFSRSCCQDFPRICHVCLCTQVACRGTLLSASCSALLAHEFCLP